MSSLKRYRWEVLFGLLGGIVLACYLVWFRIWIPQLWEHTAPAWFQTLIETVYPRFITEKERFDITFFIDKADQVILRGLFVTSLAIAFSILLKLKEAIHTRVQQFWNEQVPVQQVTILIKVYAVAMLIYTSDWYFSLIDLSKLSVFYEPTLLFRFLHIPLLDEWAMNSLVIIYVISLLFIILGKWIWQAGLLSSACFVLFRGYFQCFGKVEHTFSPWVYAALLMPFLLFELAKTQRNEKPNVANWPLKLIQLTIASCYLFSGLEKLFVSQLDWLQADTFVGYIKLHGVPLGLWLLEFEWLMPLLSWGALFFQLGFISIVFYPKLRWLFLPMGILFHWGTFAILGVGWWVHPWQIAYLFYINWSGFSKRNE